MKVGGKHWDWSSKTIGSPKYQDILTSMLVHTIFACILK